MSYQLFLILHHPFEEKTNYSLDKYCAKVPEHPYRSLCFKNGVNFFD